MNVRLLKLTSSVFLGQALSAVKINSPWFCPSWKGTWRGTWKGQIVMFSPSQPNRPVLSCPQGDIFKINFCEIINILKNNGVKVVL